LIEAQVVSSLRGKKIEKKPSVTVPVAGGLWPKKTLAKE